MRSLQIFDDILCFIISCQIFYVLHVGMEIWDICIKLFPFLVLKGCKKLKVVHSQAKSISGDDICQKFADTLQKSLLPNIFIAVSWWQMPKTARFCVNGKSLHCCVMPCLLLSPFIWSPDRIPTALCLLKCRLPGLALSISLFFLSSCCFSYSFGWWIKPTEYYIDIRNSHEQTTFDMKALFFFNIAFPVLNILITN